ncbi:hypothetical protein BRADI_3g05206v3 [Brachypodium distachyon]|uniref:Knottin scorpion toxin-like domain-containing protein n=1 Tax=Brachypodium distachyon TaxID=15368 RepID=A0A2K2CVC9_BRADI|nr:hypothetical protein BRADI_3g05206v3 [Brachypodium distachyon]
MGSKLAATAFCFFLLLTFGFGKEKTPCERPSEYYRDIECLEFKCKSSCLMEHFRDGQCNSNLQCVCTNHCRNGRRPIEGRDG